MNNNRDFSIQIKRCFNRNIEQGINFILWRALICEFVLNIVYRNLVFICFGYAHFSRYCIQTADRLDIRFIFRYRDCNERILCCRKRYAVAAAVKNIYSLIVIKVKFCHRIRLSVIYILICVHGWNYKILIAFDNTQIISATGCFDKFYTSVTISVRKILDNLGQPLFRYLAVINYNRTFW